MPIEKRWPDDLGEVLRSLREESGKKQADVARAMNIDQSRISRFENGDVLPTLTEVHDFLEAVGTARAHQYADYLGQEWVHLSRPHFGHPEISALRKAERCLQELNDLVSRDTSSSVRGQAEMHIKALTAAANYLMSVEHRIAFVGEIGVGKSVAISVLFNLLLPAVDNKPPLERTLLPRGTGRVTICEEEIATELGNFAIVVDPEPEEEVLRLVADICADAWQRTHNTADVPPQNRVSWEIERAIRNMGKLGRPSGRIVHGLADPLDELARNSANRELLCSEVFTRLTLWQRTETRLNPPNQDDGWAWLRDTLKNINYGQLDKVGLPSRIKIIVPSKLLPRSPYSVSAIDTKGLEKDDYAIRRDLMGCVDDDRTIVVLCSPFNSVPDIHSQQLLKHVSETRPERVAHCILLGLAKFGEALNTSTDSGEPVEDREEAYDVKTKHAERELSKLKLGSLPKKFYDAISDDPGPVADFLGQEIASRRAAFSERIRQAASAAKELVKGYNEVLVLKCLAEVRKRLLEYLGPHQNLPTSVTPPYVELLETISRAHQRTVWASARRSGTWWRLDAYFHLGEGMLLDARRRAKPATEGLEKLLTSMTAEENLKPVHRFLHELRESCQTWEKLFLDSAKVAGAGIFLPSLKDDNEVWSDCVAGYGMGNWSRDGVSKRLKDWFENQDRAALIEFAEKKIDEAWRSFFVGNLRNLAESLAPESENTIAAPREVIAT